MNVEKSENWSVPNARGGGLDYAGFLDRFLREPSSEDIDRDFGFVHRKSKQKRRKARRG